MPFIGSFSGSKLVQGHGAFHPAVTTIDTTTISLQNTKYPLSSTYATFGISGVSVNTAQSASAAVHKSTSGTGSGATFNITKTGTGVAYNIYNTTIGISAAGTNYAVGDTIVIDGTKLGGTAGTNDLTLIVLNNNIASIVSSTATGPTARASSLTSTSVNASPRTAYDPFNNGAITYSQVTVSCNGTISKVESANVFLSFSTGTIATLAQGMPFRVYGPGAQMGGLNPTTYYIASINSGSSYVTLSNSYANAMLATPVVVTFATSSANNASGYTFDRIPNWTAGGDLPPGLSFSNGTITGSYTIQSGNNAGLNPDSNSSGVMSGGSGGITGQNVYTAPNAYAVQIQATNARGFSSGTEIFNVQVVVPYEFRQIITTCYVMGGYASNSPWATVDKCVVSSDTTTDTANNLSHSQAYQMGLWSWNYMYCMGCGDTVSAASNITVAWNMRTETSRTTGFSTTWYDSINANACVQQEYYYGWQTAGGTIREFNLTTETNSGTPTNQTGAGSASSAASHETYGVFNTANVAWTYATRTGATRPDGTTMSQSGNYKILQNKNVPSYQWGSNSDNTWRYTNFATNTTATGGGTIPGSYSASEENHTNGQDWGYCIGFYNGSHVTTSYKWTFATASGVSNQSGTNYKGQVGNSSGWGANRD